MKRSFLVIALGASLLVNLLLVPVLVNRHLAFVYTQTLAHWKSKLIPPDAVYIGDSLTAGGRGFNRETDINLGSNGLMTYQIASLLPTAKAYKPNHIVVMAGTNDAIRGAIDETEIRKLWTDICSDPRIVVVLAPQSRSANLNERLQGLNVISKSVCEAQKRPIISLDALAGSDGLIKQEYTIDGVHLTDAGYEIWRAKLRDLGI
jgi:hypothetical protein